MRLRWGRVVVAGSVAAAGMWLGSWWFTAPTPKLEARKYPGEGACRAGDEVEVIAEVHTSDVHTEVDATGAVDRDVARRLRVAADCRDAGELPVARLWDVFHATSHGIDAIAAEGLHVDTVDGLIEVAELAADLRRNGTLVNGAVWTALQSQAYEALTTRIDDEEMHLSKSEREGFRDRLVALAEDPFTWSDLRAYEEQQIWRYLGTTLFRPALWPTILLFPRELSHARHGDHPVRRDLEHDLVEARIHAATLATTLDRWEGHPSVTRVERFGNPFVSPGRPVPPRFRPR